MKGVCVELVVKTGSGALSEAVTFKIKENDVLNVGIWNEYWNASKKIYNFISHLEPNHAFVAIT